MGTDNLTARLANLSPAKRALFELRLKEKSLDALVIQSIPRRSTRDTAPLSFPQQRLWFLNQLEPDSPAYNESKAVRLEGVLNLDALTKALNQIVARHEVLRSTIVTVDGSPRQVVANNRDIELPVIDLQTLAKTDRDSEAHRLIAEATRQPFDLSRDLMLRLLLLRLAAKEHILLVVKHHIASDGWSSGILWHELTVLYSAFSSGQVSPLPDLPIQYADFAVWQREWLQGEVLQSQISYWKKQLEGSPGILNLPTNRLRPTVQSFRGKRQFVELSKQLTQKLKALSRQQDATLFMTLLAAFQTLLYRYTGQEDIVVGSPIANRTWQEIEGLIGFFVNTLALRTDLSGNPTFRELLSRVRAIALEAYAHQDLPFEKLVEELQPERSLSHAPLFQVMFVLQNARSAVLNFEGLNVSPVPVDVERAKFDLTLSIYEAVEGLTGSLEYNTDLFDDVAITKWLEHFHILLEGIVANPDQRLSDLPALTDSERHQLVVDWNDTRRDYPSKKCVHQLFEEQVEKTPDAIAIVFEDQQLTYNELNSRANQLAHYLRKHGVGPETFVAICMERSLEMVVGLLGILKAGGAYVPVDPSYPKERLGFMLQDAQIGVLLTQQRMIEYLCEHRARVVCVDSDCRDIAQQSDENLNSEVTGANLAYVIYTSGSTGWPKGVEVPHRGVLRLLFGVEYARLGVNETFLHLAPSSFDASTFEIWGALLHGAKCVLFPGKISSPNELADVLHHYQISTLWLTASLFNTVIDEAPEALSGVRQLLIGGEALSVPHVRRAVTLLPYTQIINGYGPTESTTFTCCYPIPARLDESINSIPIGRPIANTEIYLLDSHLSPVPIGVRGELYIGGDGLARGYLNRPELTAEKFIANPFSNEPGERLYRTGDVARYLPDGNIEFLGRMDRQVKVRGYRIELGEIESALSQHPAVKNAVVVMREEFPGNKRLAAYVVAKQQPAPVTRDLCTFLKDKLPDYMIPSAFWFLDSLPVTPNGKYDRKALPAPDQTWPGIDKAFVGARDALELQLTKLWEKIIGVEPIGVRDNFFEIGGHSLLAVRLVTQMNKMFRRHLALATLFQAPTIEQLACILRQEGWSASWASLVALQPNGPRPPFFWVNGEVSNALLPDYLGPDQPLYGLVHQTQDGKPWPYTRLEDIAAHYLKEIRTVQSEGPYFLGGFCIGGLLAFEMAQQLRTQDQEVGLLVLLDPTRPRNGQLSPHFSSGFKRFSPRKPSLGDKIRRDLRKLASIESPDKLTYLLGKVREKINWRMTKVKDFAMRLGAKAYLVTGVRCRIPSCLRKFYIEAVYRQAARSYIPQVYLGNVIFLKTQGSHDPQIPWGRLAGGGLEIVEVAGTHTEIVFKEPQIRDLAEQLRACLQKTQATVQQIS